MITNLTNFTNSYNQLKIEENITTYSKQFNQFYIYCNHNKNEIKESPKIRVKVEGSCYETET